MLMQMLYMDLYQWMKVSIAEDQLGKEREETALGAMNEGELQNNKVSYFTKFNVLPILQF